MALAVAAVIFTGCTGGEEGTANTAPIPAETTVVVPITAAVVTTTVAATTAVGAVPDSVPTPVGKDYRVPVVVKVVPTTDAEREVLAAATELIAKYHTFELREVSDRAQLSAVMMGDALEEFAEVAQSLSDDINVPSNSDRVVIEAIKGEADSATVLACEVDGTRVYVRSKTGDLTLDNDVLATLHMSYELRRTAGGWRIATFEVVATAEGVDECERS